MRQPCGSKRIDDLVAALHVQPISFSDVQVLIAGQLVKVHIRSLAGVKLKFEFPSAATRESLNLLFGSCSLIIDCSM